MAKRGTPLLDDHKQAEVVVMVGMGCTFRIAAGYAGCSEYAIRKTARQVPEFAEKLRLARSNAEFALLRNLRAAGKKQQYWRANAWLLERTMPERYGPRSPETITMPQIAQLMTEFVEVIEREVPDAYRASLLATWRAMIRDLLAGVIQQRRMAKARIPSPALLPAPAESPQPASPMSHLGADHDAPHPPASVESAIVVTSQAVDERTP